MTTPVTDLITIDPAPPANPGLDFAVLKSKGVDLVQQLAGKIWTDYNESDPGVTILEQVCYALTELSYRAEFPVQDFLIDPLDGRIDPRRQALYPAKRIFPCNPVTEKDYRKLILDRVPELGNVWLTPHRPAKKTSRSVDGLYDIALYVPGLEPPPCGPIEEEDRIRNMVRRVYCRHRNLCEDVRAVHVLRPVRAVVHADVSLAEMRTPEAILAGILFNVGNLIAPEPRRRPLKSLVDAGVPPSAIFDGPLLINGFIDDGQLHHKADCIPVQDVARAIARSEGVQGVRNVKVRKGGKEYSGNEPIKVRKTQILQLDTRPDKRGFSIRLFRNGLEIRPDAGRVQRELDKLWAAQRRTYRLAAQYAEYFAFPEGRRRDFEKYFSIQDQFPNVYGINAYGLPAGSSREREAKARQLKGYLLVFDQLLADFFAQLAHVRDLYSTVDTGKSTWCWQSLEGSVPNLEPLLKGGGKAYLEGLRTLVEDQAAGTGRRNRFLDFLLALYAERLDASLVWDVTPGDEVDEDTGERLVRARRELLRHLVPSTHNRSRGFDYLERPSAGNFAGMLIKSRIQLGMPVFDQRPFVDVLEEFGVELAEGEAAGGRPLQRHAEHIQEQLAPVTAEDDDGTAVLPRGLKIPEELVLGAAEVAELRMGPLPGESAVSLVWKSRSKGDWRLLGKYPDRESAQSAGRAFLDLLCGLGRHGRQLYIVEHTLLRFGRFRDPDEKFIYDFTLTAVTAAADGDEDYKTFFREVIRQNTPSHIVARGCFLGPHRMQRFENLFFAWHAALRSRNRKEICHTSAALRHFLVDPR